MTNMWSGSISKIGHWEFKTCGLVLKGALATILTQKKYMLWKLVNSFKMMK